jgi:hypothetical protein
LARRFDHFADRDRQWFKSRLGLALRRFREPRRLATTPSITTRFSLSKTCSWKERFTTSVLANAGVRFYAGAPLITRTVYALGIYRFALSEVKNSRDVLRRLFSAADDARRSGARIASHNEMIDRAHPLGPAAMGPWFDGSGGGPTA